VLVGVDLGARAHFDGHARRAGLLAESAGDVPVARVILPAPAPDAALFVGSRQGRRDQACWPRPRAPGVIFDQALSPVQQRNLERTWACRWPTARR
jgi:GTP-binding protein HflX